MKTKLSELLEMITPLPWGDDERLSVISTPRDTANMIYSRHAANVLPELVEAFHHVQNCDFPEAIRFRCEGCVAAEKAIATAEEINDETIE